MKSQSRTEEEALFDDDDDDAADATTTAYAAMLSGEDAKGSEQRLKSFTKAPIEHTGTQITKDGHHIQEVTELSQTVVTLSADLTKSPPVLKVSASGASERLCMLLTSLFLQIFAMNPWAQHDRT